MAAKGGIDPEKTLAVINAGSGQNSATLTKIPNFILNGKFDMAAPMYIIEKDVMVWRMEAEHLDVPQNVASATYHTLRQALAMGLREGDLSEGVRVVERAAEKWDRVVTTRAPSRSLDVPTPFEGDSTRLSDAGQISRIVKRTEMVHTVKPTVVNILMAFLAIVVHHQGFSRDEIG